MLLVTRQNTKLQSSHYLRYTVKATEDKTAGGRPTELKINRRKQYAYSRDTTHQKSHMLKQ